MKKILIFIILIMFVILLLLLLKKEKNNILYSWNMDTLSDERLFDVIDEYNIGTLYQDFSSNYLDNIDNTFVEQLSQINVDVYHLCGEPSWAIEKDAYNMIKEIDKIINYNSNVLNKIKGIVFDIEPYTESKDNFDFELYVNNMKLAYQYAKAKSLKMVIVMPIWFDKLDITLLEELIINGADELSLMNYNINKTESNIKNEVLIAKKYNKYINTIYEVNYNKDNYFKSKEEIDKDFKKIYETYKYSKLRKAYHYYDKIILE